jgi:hypothetical protein
LCGVNGKKLAMKNGGSEQQLEITCPGINIKATGSLAVVLLVVLIAAWMLS